ILAKNVSRYTDIQFAKVFNWKCDQLRPILTSFLEIRYTPNNAFNRSFYLDQNRVWYERYINTPWMHTPWLTKSILECVLDFDIERSGRGLSQREMRNTMIGFPVLLVILSGVLYLIRPLPGMISPWNPHIHELYWMIIGILGISLLFGIGLLPSM